MPLVPTILPALDAIRSIGGILGLRPFTVTVRRRVWTGFTPGAPGSTKTDTDTVLVNQAPDGTLQPVLVRQVTRKEIFASGGQLTSRDWKVGPMTPVYAASLGLLAGGIDDTTLDPMPTPTQTYQASSQLGLAQPGLFRLGGVVASSAIAVEMIWILSTNDGGTHGLPAGGAVCEKTGEEATALHYYVYLRQTGRPPT
jgi:hypothetical protein